MNDDVFNNTHVIEFERFCFYKCKASTSDSASSSSDTPTETTCVGISSDEVGQRTFSSFLALVLAANDHSKSLMSDSQIQHSRSNTGDIRFKRWPRG